MSVSAPFKLAVPDSLFLHEFDVLFRAVLSWGHIVFLFRVHGHEFNSFRRATRSKRLRQFQLRPIEAFLYHYRAIDLWEWEIRLLDEPSQCRGREALSRRSILGMRILHRALDWTAVTRRLDIDRAVVDGRRSPPGGILRDA
jgi:hypothetical protein